MAYMKNIATGAFVGPMLDDSPEYLYLASLRDAGTPARPTYEDVGTQEAGTAAAKAPLTMQALVAATAAGADAAWVVGRAQYAGTVAKVEYIPVAAVTGANTNSRTLNLNNVGAAGAGSLVPATLALVSAVNLTANASNSLTLGLSAQLVVVANDEFQFQSLHVGTGIADPGGLVIVTLNRE